MTASPPPPGADPEPQRPVRPTCYRHPDRVTGLSCTRCERPICPDCMTAASVGQHCPECVAEGNRRVRRARTVFGGGVVSAPYVTWTILGLMGVGYVAQMLTSGSPLSTSGSSLVRQFGMWGGGVAFQGEWYRLITAAFLHSGLWHILFNGWAMYALGPQLERWLGHGRFLALWVLGALGGSVLSLLATPGSLSIGASGAIFALFGAVLMLGRRLGLDVRMVWMLIGLNLVITFVFPSIAWTAHIGGLAVGMLLGAVFAHLPGRSASPRTRNLVHTAALVLLAAVLAALVFASPVLLTAFYAS
ncbi:rhomboid family intramembrane serine protease [Nocardiopsis changdeensis]|uniref:Rhomboid family intramembrane serine protease n=1 Tax=Nocardiopsis changdeensis TaxID=2831969 RepID=A0ABX8BKU9_9ACTN|nr:MULTISPECIES: rhomboid family intramembrane serine protease [Nocardiopsis]QUX22865.1 rhomboid family intramembrane serine protease [Nocardiopsis changdeensis]QYX38807.1 rhomboid family intramembrane serine protease [Nocardiopsis sp. MT53]